MTISGPSRAEVRRLAEGRGIRVEEKGGRISLVLKAATADEALLQLGLLSELLSPKA